MSAQSLTHQPFLALNADRSNITPIRSGVIKRSPKHKPISGARFKAIIGKEPDRTHVEGAAAPLVTQPSQAPPVEKPPEPATMSPKKSGKRSAESIAKQKATLAAKKKSKKRGAREGTKAAFVRANLDKDTSEIVALGKKQGILVTASYVYNIRAQVKGNGHTQPTRERQARDDATIGDLLQTIDGAMAEIRRRLSQLSL